MSKNNPGKRSDDIILEDILKIDPDFDSAGFLRWSDTQRKKMKMTPSTFARTALALCQTAAEKGNPYPWELHPQQVEETSELLRPVAGIHAPQILTARISCDPEENPEVFALYNEALTEDEAQEILRELLQESEDEKRFPSDDESE